MKNQKIKAVGLFSGGLDSMIAIKLIEDQGIDVEAITFKSSFFGTEETLQEIAKKNTIDLKIIDISKEYIKVVKNPKHGHGKNMNPCIDCKIFFLREAEKYARHRGAHFVFTGEVLGQRPMSQNTRALQTIHQESGLEKRLVRPLSGKLLPPTEAEENGWIDREKLLDISGRSREKQLKLAQKYNLQDYGSPSGGCLLTEKLYTDKLRDLFAFKKRIATDDVDLLKAGRYLRLQKNILIVGRNKEDNKALSQLQKKHDWLFTVKDSPSPTTLLRGPKNTKALYTAAAITAHYSKTTQNKVTLLYGEDFENEMIIPSPTEEQFEAIRKNMIGRI